MSQWWRDAVFYQVYPRSFTDANGDGIGDLRGITSRLDYLVDVGVDALWISPCFVSPQVDNGYDVQDYRAIDPMFGTMADMDALIEGAHSRGLKVTLDFVPNHTSDQHEWFRAAVADGPGSPARQRYLFLDGRGANGDEPPNNWRAVFGGPSWTRVVESDGKPGQWYYHLFAAEQPDLNWRNPEVVQEFCDVLRFWLDRGIDGFRIDVSDALIKDDTWPDTPDGSPVIPKGDDCPVHDVYRAFRRVLDEYPGDRMAVIETGADDDIVALFLRPDEMQLAFNFRFVHAAFQGDALREAIDSSLAANAQVGAPTTWVTDNHDTSRSVGRYGSGAALSGAYVPGTMAQYDASAVDEAAGQRRARAMALLLLALPGAAYIYNGQELGLPNVDDLPEDALRDPIWERSGHTQRGRDNCRVPLPWSGDHPPYGFTEGEPWLPMPEGWSRFTVDVESSEPSSMLNLYRAALRIRRRSSALGRGSLTWVSSGPEGLVLDVVGAHDRVRIAVNMGAGPTPLPSGELLLSSVAVIDDTLPPDAAAWVRLAS